MRSFSRLSRILRCYCTVLNTWLIARRGFAGLQRSIPRKYSQNLGIQMPNLHPAMFPWFCSFRNVKLHPKSNSECIKLQERYHWIAIITPPQWSRVGNSYCSAIFDVGVNLEIRKFSLSRLLNALNLLLNTRSSCIWGLCTASKGRLLTHTYTTPFNKGYTKWLIHSMSDITNQLSQPMQLI